LPGPNPAAPPPASFAAEALSRGSHRSLETNQGQVSRQEHVDGSYSIEFIF
jgi:hypothetical protein